jgi:hypothetical protein
MYRQQHIRLTHTLHIVRHVKFSKLQMSFVQACKVASALGRNDAADLENGRDEVDLRKEVPEGAAVPFPLQ